MKTVRLTSASCIPGWVGELGARFYAEDDIAAQAVASGLLEYTEDQAVPPVTQVEALGVSEVPEDERPRQLTTEERYLELHTPEELEAMGLKLPDTLNDDDPDKAVTEPDTDKAVKKPYGNHSKQLWAEYAVAQGHDPVEAAKLTKADLMSLYGERL